MRATSTIVAMVLAMAAWIAPLPAPAQGFYIGGSVGKSDIDDEVTAGLITSGSVDGKDTGFKIFGGYQFDQNFGVEFEYVDLGRVSYSGSFFGTPVTGGKVEVWGLNMSAVGTLPLNPSFALFGKVGLFAWEAKASDVTGGVPFSAKDDGADLSIGLGMSYNFTKNVTARVEWQRFMMDVADADLLSIGLVYKF